jgi:transposase
MNEAIIKPYLQQLISLSEETGWELRDACIDAGISDSTFYRWINKKNKPRLKEAETVAKYMCTYPRN